MISSNFQALIISGVTCLKRAVHTYVERSSNNKHLELTFAKTESRRELLKFIHHDTMSSVCEHHQYLNRCMQQVWFSYTVLTSYIFLIKPLHASSISKAQTCFKDYNHEQPILVGGKKDIPIKTSELEIAHHALHFEVADIVVTSCRSILCKNLLSDGMLLCVGEHLLVKPVHSHSGSQVVQPSSQVLFTLATKILRKVMLYPDPDNLTSPTCYVVLDYYRKALPCSEQDIIIPVYPEINDMVQVCGSDDEIWFGHVCSVDRVNKACNVNFYIQDCTCPGRYKQESFGRLSTNIVQWESIVRICHGYWSNNGRFWYFNH